MKKKTFLFYFLAIFIIAVLSCSKQGPAGPQGATGSQGPAGATGSQGPKGDTGVANVIYSNWLNVIYQADTVQASGVIDTVGFYSSIAASQLDSSILSHGSIQVYINIGDSTTPNVTALPYFDVFSGLSITCSFQLHTILLYSNGNVGTTTDQNGLKTLQYRYILIPGSIPGHLLTNLPDWKNYNAVKGFLGITN